MMTIDRMVLRAFLPVFAMAMLFFVLIIQLIDLFASIVRFLNNEVALIDIARVQLLYMPQALQWALPIALLFAVAYTLGTLYANNELISVFGAGLPLARFVRPLIIVGILASVGAFFFQEYVVIDALRAKEAEAQRHLNVGRSASNTDVTIRSAGGRIIYSAEYYNDATQELVRLVVIERDANGRLLRRIDATSARWNGSVWLLQGAREFVVVEEEGATTVVERRVAPDGVPSLTTPPERFQRSTVDVDEMPLPEAREWIVAQQQAGQPFREALTAYHERYSFAFTPFVVVLLSGALGGRFRRNILLMSLLVSLVISVIYYVANMVGGLLAGAGVLPPALGAWIATALATAGGIVLFRNAPT